MNVAEDASNASGCVLYTCICLSYYRNPNSDGMTEWPEFQVDTQEHMVFNRVDSTGKFLFAKEWRFWTELVPKIIEHSEHFGQSAFGSKTVEVCDKQGNCH